jgi:hypothetical protein
MFAGIPDHGAEWFIITGARYSFRPKSIITISVPISREARREKNAYNRRCVICGVCQTGVQAEYKQVGSYHLSHLTFIALCQGERRDRRIVHPTVRRRLHSYVFVSPSRKELDESLLMPLCIYPKFVHSSFPDAEVSPCGLINDSSYASSSSSLMKTNQTARVPVSRLLPKKWSPMALFRHASSWVLLKP